MALQTASLRHACDVSVHTTFSTGMVQAFAEEVVAWVRHEFDAPRRARIHGGLVVAYVVGAVSGWALETPWRLGSLAIPVAILLTLTVAMRRLAREAVSATP